jgi:hypothetical protein
MRHPVTPSPRPPRHPTARDRSDRAERRVPRGAHPIARRPGDLPRGSSDPRGGEPEPAVPRGLPRLPDDLPRDADPDRDRELPSSGGRAAHLDSRGVRSDQDHLAGGAVQPDDVHLGRGLDARVRRKPARSRRLLDRVRGSRPDGERELRFPRRLAERAGNTLLLLANRADYADIVFEPAPDSPRRHLVRGGGQLRAPGDDLQVQQREPAGESRGRARPERGLEGLPARSGHRGSDNRGRRTFGPFPAVECGSLHGPSRDAPAQFHGSPCAGGGERRDDDQVQLSGDRAGAPGGARRSSSADTRRSCSTGSGTVPRSRA